MEKNSRTYRCVCCNKKTIHEPDGKMWIYHCQECGEFKTNDKFKSIVNI